MANALTLYRASMLPGNDLGNATTETQFPNGRAAQLNLTLPSNNSLNNKSFRVRISGRVATTSNVTFTVTLYFGFSATLASNTLLFTTNAITVNTVSSNWELWADCFWSANGTITGRAEGQIANQVFGPGAFTNIASADPNRDSSTFLQSGVTYGFTVTGKFSGSSSGNHAFIDDLSLEMT